MGFTTLSALVTTVKGLTVTGVKTKREYRPKLISAAQLPMMYSRPPTRKNEISTLSYGQDLKRATIEIVILLAMLNLDKPEANNEKIVIFTDRLADALEASAADLGMDAYEIQPDEDTITDGTVPVQVIIATVEVSG